MKNITLLITEKYGRSVLISCHVKGDTESYVNVYDIRVSHANNIFFPVGAVIRDILNKL